MNSTNVLLTMKTKSEPKNVKKVSQPSIVQILMSTKSVKVLGLVMMLLKSLKMISTA